MDSTPKLCGKMDSPKIEPTKAQLESRTELYNLIVRHWFHHLTALERLAVIFVFDRTLGWNKEWEVITVNHFIEGVFYYDEESEGFRCSGAPFTKDPNRARKIIDGLVEKGAILRRKVPRSRKNLREFAINKDWEYPSISVPKRVVRKKLGGEPVRPPW